MVTIIKLAVALALLTAAFQGARVSMSNYQFEDAIKQVLLFAPSASDAEVTQKVLALAEDYGLPIEAADVTVSEKASDRLIEVTYTTDVAFLPGIYTRPMTFNPTASVRMLTPPRR